MDRTKKQCSQIRRRLEYGGDSGRMHFTQEEAPQQQAGRIASITTDLDILPKMPKIQIIMEPSRCLNGCLKVFKNIQVNQKSFTD